MDERDALRLLAADLPHAGDDAAVVDDTVITTDMLHESTDFPDGTTRYTAGWRAVGASLSDVAAMGASATAAVAVYADAEFRADDLSEFVRGAADVCEAVDAEYVGGDLDTHEEFTTATTAIGELRADDASEPKPVLRSGADAGDVLCVTGEWGRSAAGLRLFDAGDVERANGLFRFEPRVGAGRALAPHATAMMDSSDGFARSLHQLAEASGVGFAVDRDALPVHPALDDLVDGPADRWEAVAHFGEDFELVVTIPEAAVDSVIEASPTPITPVGEVVGDDDGITADDEPLPDRGYTHGSD